MIANAWIKAHAFDDLPRVQTLHLGVGVQLVEVTDPQRQIGVGKKLDCLCFGKAHDKSIYVFLDCTFLQQTSKSICSFHQTSILYIGADNNAARIQIVMQGFRLAQEFRAEDDIVTVVFLAHRSRKANRNCGLNYHDSIRVVLDDQLNNRFNRRSIKEVLLAVIVSGSRDNNKVRVLVGRFRIKRCNEIQIFLCEILLNILVLNRSLLLIDEVYLFRDNIHCHNLIMLTQQRGDG